MSSAFAAKKQKILQQLAVPDASYTDLSPKGSVDEGIRALVDEINELDTLVTTSSCAGRIAVYLEGTKKGSTKSTLNEDAQNPGLAAAGGKGGGQWLFVSHDPLTLSEKPVAPMFGLSDQTNPSAPAFIKDVRWVRCKFEPMVGDMQSFHSKSRGSYIHTQTSYLSVLSLFSSRNTFDICLLLTDILRSYMSCVHQLAVRKKCTQQPSNLDLEKAAFPASHPTICGYPRPW